jgi:hypothetical protein
MAKRKQAAAEPDHTTAEPLTAAQLSEALPPTPPAPPQLADQSKAEEFPQREWRANPFAVKTVNLDGYQLQLQESRPEHGPWQMQIKFGSGSREEMPSDGVRDFIKVQRKTITTREGEVKDIQAFHWNDENRAWGTTIEYDQPKTSREASRKVFDEVVKLVAADCGVTPERTGGPAPF